MKWARVLVRLALLSLAAAAFVGLTEMYAGSVRPRFADPYRQRARRQRPPEPQLSRFPSFVGEFLVLALIAVGGRIVFRLRLSSPPRRDEAVILLELD